MNEDNTDTLEIVAEVTGVHKPILSNTDPLPTSCMESFTSGFTGCLSEQKAVTCEPCPNEQSDHPTASQVTVKEEIEEVCIGEMEGVSEGLCKTEREQEEGADADEIEKGRGFKRKMEEEVLDLSLSRKGGWSDTDRRRGGLEEGAGSEATLLMEVDEILQQEVDEEEDEEVKEEDAQVLSREKEMAVNFDSVNLEAPLSSSPPPSSPSASPSSSPVDPSLDSLLLIDDQGIPYMLTPDGQKLFQVELPKPCNAFTARPRPMSKQVKAEDSTVICSPDVAPSKPGSLSTLPYQASGVSPSCLTSPASSESSVISKTVLPSEAPPNSPTHSLKAAPSPASKPSPTPHTSADLFFPDDSSYPTSGTPPPATIFPTNHPKSLSLSPNCPRRILYCQFCPRAFYYLSDLERHSITHSQSKPHVCPLCSKAFKRSSHLERHKHIHTGQRNFICPICSKRFREAGELLRHQRVHTGEKPFQCPQCHMRFAERNTLRRHAKRKHQDQQGPDGQEEGCHVSDDAHRPQGEDSSVLRDTDHYKQ
ncbi:hypothetical protein AAFF_G00070410 [Aldrovandia affinis]|uniref:C2H2-type domain-containing protein n=1 Tax=Aldrovandia affinis TaxID=143900 RepID=A0AAD7RYQ8_9TELE|nr:hypothetical protein AAFF_G00070410 [Aldrovandia affinis]